jgi:signal transduction histidine kinase
VTESENTFAPTEELNRLAALGKVSGELLHDMANLVAVVRGRATLALGDARTGRIPIGELDRLAEASEELGSMLRDVMEVLAGRAISPEVVFDPRTVTERVIERFLDTTPPVRIRLSSSVPAHLRVAGRASFFSRAVLNLLTNAARHAESEIEVSLSTIERQEDHLLVLTVEDDGPGMDPQQVEAAFQPLVSGEAGRPGLGLSSVAWSMSHLAGEVSCHRSAALGAPASSSVCRSYGRGSVPGCGCRLR